jgi:hypothetical protein
VKRGKQIDVVLLMLVKVLSIRTEPSHNLGTQRPTTKAVSVP